MTYKYEHNGASNIKKRLPGVGEALHLIFLCLVILSYRLCDIFSFHF